MRNEKIPLIVIVGPTASGKTALSIELAEKFDSEIISIDSVQIYKKFNIGSAKISKEEMRDIPHHLIDILNPDEKMSIYEFQKTAREKIDEVYSKGKIPILIGGTGYYMNGVIYDYKFGEYENKIENTPLEDIKNYLLKNFPDTYNSLDLNNERRIINAYNYVLTEKKSITENKDGENIYHKFNPHIIVVNRDREILYNKINDRVDCMISEGLIEEVKDIIKNYGFNLQPLGAIGYKEVVSYLSNEISKEFMIESIKQNSRRYAKRQITWFKNKMINTNWYNLELHKTTEIEEQIKQFLLKHYENK